MKKKRLIIIISVVAVFAIYDFLLRYDLRHYGVFTNGIILSSVYPAKSSMVFTYRYFYMNEEKEDNSQAGVRYPGTFYGKSFPVVVSTLTKRSMILITPAHFKRFNIPYPNSLKWVLQYLN